MKCKFCGCEVFTGHQVCHMDVLVDGNTGCFLSNMRGGADAAIYEAGDPFGPFQCCGCGAEYDELAEDMPETGQPLAGWMNGRALFVKESESETAESLVQQWKGRHYTVVLSRWTRNSSVSLSVRCNTSSIFFPVIFVDSDDKNGRFKQLLMGIPNIKDVAAEDCRSFISSLEAAEEETRRIEQFFLNPLNDGTFDWAATQLGNSMTD